MEQHSSSFWGRARQAQEQLAREYLDHPDVTMIDLGYAATADQTEHIAVRVHVRDHWFESPSEQRVAFPEQVEGIPVAVVRGEYRPGE